MRWVDTYFPFTDPSFELEIYFKVDFSYLKFWMIMLALLLKETYFYVLCGVLLQKTYIGVFCWMDHHIF